MENLSNAIFMAFAMIALVIGLSFGIYLINLLNSTSNTLIKNNDNTKDYELISYDSSSISKQGNATSIKTRTVSADTVVSMLYRYYLEDFTVEIYYKGSKKPDQIFDLEIEGILNSATPSPEYNAYKTLYGDGKTETGSVCNLYGAPWITNRERYTKQRVDMFVSSKKGYLNNKKSNILIDYTNNGFNSHMKNKFDEYFIQYTFDGETISSDDEGEETETIVGSRRAQSKIIIRYKEK